ncbi:MAG: hypothetical protein DRP88_00880 [Candidatus Neomarinimicrobiota bacterium]|nr:MAG: hypothetical protein DRP88_00880 [Candidatus Neomarinimicrobiota bacterium]
MLFKKRFNLIVVFVNVIAALLIVYTPSIAQVVGTRERAYHERGMIRETLYNDGVISRPWIICKWPGPGEYLFEWPKYSETYIDGQYYYGHHMSHGGGIFISANLRSKHTKEERIYAFCGGTGERTQTQEPYGTWSFPISMKKIENYPLLPNGDINPNFNPDEAEEIIIAKWATPVGITVTRTSRAWSYPDYDDMIIYEYLLVYDGNTDSDTSTIEMDHDGDGKPDEDLVDVLFHISHSFATSMLGFNRWYPPSRGEYYIGWYYDEYQGIYRQDLRWTFDPDYWLLFNTTVHTGSEDSDREWWAFKPEPDPDHFMEFATTKLNGGGLLGAGCPGLCLLFWDTNHLANLNPNDPNRDPTLYNLLKDANGEYFELDENGHIKQPWNMKTGTPRSSVVKVKDRACDMDERWWTVYGKVGVPKGVPSDGNMYVLPDGKTWYGRARYEWDESYNGTQLNIGFGPYVLKPGDSLEFAYATVIGYGATDTKICCGGQRDKQFFKVRTLHRPIILKETDHDTEYDVDTEIDTVLMTNDYLGEFGYPDYVNSDSIITVNQVAHKAQEAYIGRPLPWDPENKIPEVIVFPEDNPRPSKNPWKYKNIPVPPPAPVLNIVNTSDGKVKITWKPTPEQFETLFPNDITGRLVKYYIWRSERKNGPWTLLDSLNVGEGLNDDGLYEYIDDDPAFKLGTTKYYAVTSVDENGYQSGKTNITEHTRELASVEKMGKVYVVPNPFYVKSGFVDNDKMIKFYGLPERCEIRIYSFAGQLVETIHHDANVNSDSWFQVTRNNQDLASGIYFFVVVAENGDKYTGKFVVIK